jgi:hypothetical protein
VRSAAGILSGRISARGGVVTARRVRYVATAQMLLVSNVVCMQFCASPISVCIRLFGIASGCGIGLALSLSEFSAGAKGELSRKDGFLGLSVIIIGAPQHERTGVTSSCLSRGLSASSVPRVRQFVKRPCFQRELKPER